MVGQTRPSQCVGINCIRVGAADVCTRVDAI